ncbi:hypothetical protein [Nodularia chucula]|uniref:hypothetical protein n=1 Tax=Nodularia chucula TaxID=3093667 RepID=UPI0039C73715
MSYLSPNAKFWCRHSVDAGGEKNDIGFDSNDGSTRGVEASIDNSVQPQHEQILLVRIIPASGHRAISISKFYQPTE